MTRDTPAPGVVIWQPRRGFRYGSEAFWLAGLALEGGNPKRVLDLGTGSGVVAALLAAQGADAVGVDVRAEWGPLWERTLAETRVSGRLRLVHGDVRTWEEGGFDVVVSNPPYFPAESGPMAELAWKAAARTELAGTLEDFVRVGVRAGRRLVLVLPIEREAEAVKAAGNAGIEVVQVGKRRVLVAVSVGGQGHSREVIGEADPRVVGWYGRVGASP